MLTMSGCGKQDVILYHQMAPFRVAYSYFISLSTFIFFGFFFYFFFVFSNSYAFQVLITWEKSEWTNERVPSRDPKPGPRAGLLLPTPFGLTDRRKDSRVAEQQNMKITKYAQSDQPERKRDDSQGGQKTDAPT